MKTRRVRPGFTLVELLVVITIIVLVSAAVLPAIIPALSGRQIGESARILQAALAGMRDAAIRANDNRGLRLLPDPTLTAPPLAAAGLSGAPAPQISFTNAGTSTLAYNRFVSIEPAGDYKEGRVSLAGYGGPASMHPIPPFPPANVLSTMTADWSYLPPAIGTNGSPPPYPWPSPGLANVVYPCYQTSNPNPPPSGTVLMIEQETFFGGGPPKPTDAALPPPNAPTSWYWNIRIGDKIRMSDAGRSYTVVGPMSTVNPELFVNVGPPGSPSPLSRTWTYANGTASARPEFLFVVNGQDDGNDGYVDNGWNGIDDNFNGVIDDLFEWTEMETFIGTINGSDDLEYTIDRRPVPTRTAREVTFPPNIVVDATSWNTTRERSRLPIDPFTLNVDIMISPNGTVVPTTLYSTPSIPGLSGMQAAFFHFWLSDRSDVHELGEMWGLANGVANPNPNSFLASNDPAKQTYMLPMPLGTPNYTPPNASLVLKGERRLVTLFTRNGLLLSSDLETFNGQDISGGINTPFIDAQVGVRESK